MQIGSCQAHSSWVTALQWAPEPVDGHLLLCSGSSDGSLRLHCAPTSALATAASPPIPAADGGLLDLLGAVCQPDQRSVVCLDFSVRGSTAAGEHPLLVLQNDAGLLFLDSAKAGRLLCLSKEQAEDCCREHVYEACG